MVYNILSINKVHYRKSASNALGALSTAERASSLTSDQSEFWSTWPLKGW